MIGKTIWKYRITEFLGSGGSAKVWKAYDERTKREVAIKILPEDFDPSLLTRFKHETRTIAKLDHPNIIKIYDIGTEGKANYYVMDYVKGKTLKEVIHERYDIEKGSISSEEVVTISLELARALEYIHSLRVYHRDIKPGNILITEPGRVILMDFGIAKQQDETTLTAVGTLMGTPLYMSPEQLQAQEVDQRSDIYQLGIVMYKMATGKVPFEGENSYSAAARRLTEKIPPPSRYNPVISPQLERIILKCTLRDKTQRYQSATPLAADLLALSENREVTVELRQPPAAGSTRSADATVPAKAAAQAPAEAEALPAWRSLPVVARASAALNAILLVVLLVLALGQWMTPPLRVGLTKPQVKAEAATATISFKTGIPVESIVMWGQGDDLSHATRASSEPATTHRAVLEGLEPGQEYTYRIWLAIDRKKVAVVEKIETAAGAQLALAFKTRSREELEQAVARVKLGPAPEELALIEDAVRSGEYRVRLQAVRALAELKSPRHYDTFRSLLGDPNNEVREAAHKAIAPLVVRGP